VVVIKSLLALILGAGLVFGGLVVLNSGAALGCPTALLTGTLARDATELVVRSDLDPGATAQVKWAFPNHVDDLDGVLVVRDLFGSIRAREGDHVAIGGGETEGRFGQCGPFAVERPAS
jgi:hypothetical protein